MWLVELLINLFLLTTLSLLAAGVVEGVVTVTLAVEVALGAIKLLPILLKKVRHMPLLLEAVAQVEVLLEQTLVLLVDCYLALLLAAVRVATSRQAGQAALAVVVVLMTPLFRAAQALLDKEILAEVLAELAQDRQEVAVAKLLLVVRAETILPVAQTVEMEQHGLMG
jgi:hypothetical protein